jgi:Fe-S-cluster containining protein
MPTRTTNGKPRHEQTRPITAIKVGNRHRKLLGDLEPLAESLETVGLLHPVVVDAKNRLIAGQRRLEAAKLLGWKTVPVRVIDLDGIVLGVVHDVLETLRQVQTFTKAVGGQRQAEKVVTVLARLAQEAFSIVDCTKCANCCRILRPVFSDQDIARIAEHLEMAREEFIAAYLEKDEEQGHYRTKTRPCPFLGADSKCTIYDVRPEKCRGYPFTDKPDFPCMSITHANNAVACPAVFYMVEQMKKRMGR